MTVQVFQVVPCSPLAWMVPVLFSVLFPSALIVISEMDVEHRWAMVKRKSIYVILHMLSRRRVSELPFLAMREDHKTFENPDI